MHSIHFVLRSYISCLFLSYFLCRISFSHRITRYGNVYSIFIIAYINFNGCSIDVELTVFKNDQNISHSIRFDDIQSNSIIYNLCGLACGVFADLSHTLTRAQGTLPGGPKKTKNKNKTKTTNEGD